MKTIVRPEEWFASVKQEYDQFLGRTTAVNRLNFVDSNLGKDFDFIADELIAFQRVTSESKAEVVRKEEERLGEQQQQKNRGVDMSKPIVRLDELEKLRMILDEDKVRLEKKRFENESELKRLEKVRVEIRKRLDENAQKRKQMSSDMIILENNINVSVAYLKEKAKTREELESGLDLLDNLVKTTIAKNYKGIPNSILDLLHVKASVY